jgi:hypothetical protein
MPYCFHYYTLAGIDKIREFNLEISWMKEEGTKREGGTETV